MIAFNFYSIELLFCDTCHFTWNSFDNFQDVLLAPMAVRLETMYEAMLTSFDVISLHLLFFIFFSPAVFSLLNLLFIWIRFIRCHGDWRVGTSVRASINIVKLIHYVCYASLKSAGAMYIFNISLALPISSP